MITKRDEQDWQQYCAEWPARLVHAADVAFAEYVSGAATRTQLEVATQMADRACREGISPIRRGKTPSWFRKRLRRVLGSKCFDHLTFASPWFENAGSAKVPLKVTVFNGPCHASGIQLNEVFMVEPIRPWVLDRETFSKVTEETFDAMAAEYQRKFLAVFSKLLQQPAELASALRCRLHTQREASSGWKYFRAMFVPLDVQEPHYFTPESHELRTCACRVCTRPKSRWKA